MQVEKKIGDRMVRLIKGEITLLEVDAFVYYARPDLQLGAGYGNAISVRGGLKVQEELNEIGSAKVTEAVATTAGKLKAKHIIHAVGPAFQEEDTEAKLRATTENALKKAEEKGVAKLALPAMGVGFYGIPLEESARITMEVVKEYLQKESGIEEVIFCVNDAREYRPFQATLESLA